MATKAEMVEVFPYKLSTLFESQLHVLNLLNQISSFTEKIDKAENSQKPQIYMRSINSIEKYKHQGHFNSLMIIAF